MNLKITSTLCLLFLSPAAHALSGLPSASKDLAGSLRQEVNSYSNDNREVVKDFEFPWSAVGLLRWSEAIDEKQSDNQGKGGICTASLVAPDMILTNAHCILKPDGQVVEKNIRFYLQYNNTKKIHSRYEAKVTKIEAIGRTEFRKDFRDIEDRADDWAILRLDRKLGHVVGWLAVRAFSNEELFEISKSSNVYMMGYSADRMGLPLLQTCQIKDSKGDLVFTNCSGNGGSSGSPILRLETRSDGQTMGAILALHFGIFEKDHWSSSQSRKDYSFGEFMSGAMNASRIRERLQQIMIEDENRSR